LGNVFVAALRYFSGITLWDDAEKKNRNGSSSNFDYRQNQFHAARGAVCDSRLPCRRGAIPDSKLPRIHKVLASAAGARSIGGANRTWGGDEFFE
jgi:hypothetical protein